MSRAGDDASATGTLLAVCGLAFEAEVVAGRGIRTLSRGGRSDALASAIADELRRGVVGLVSFGLAGALTSSHEPGALIVAREVVDATGRRATHSRWSTSLLQVLPHAVAGTVAGVDRIVSTATDKAALARETGADVVDMESHVVARMAQDHGVPFVVLRAVADPLRRSLPPAAMVAMREDGRVDLPAVLLAIARGPWQLPELLHIGLDTRRALDALRQSRLLLGRRLGHPDLDQLPVDVV